MGTRCFRSHDVNVLEQSVLLRREKRGNPCESSSPPPSRGVAPLFQGFPHFLHQLNERLHDGQMSNCVVSFPSVSNCFQCLTSSNCASVDLAAVALELQNLYRQVSSAPSPPPAVIFPPHHSGTLVPGQLIKGSKRRVEEEELPEPAGLGLRGLWTRGTVQTVGGWFDGFKGTWQDPAPDLDLTRRMNRTLVLILVLVQPPGY